MSQNISRRTALAGLPIAAAGASLAALPAIAGSLGEGDAELRRLWALHLVQLKAYAAADKEHTRARSAFEAELLKYPKYVNVRSGAFWATDECQALFRKHGLDQLYPDYNNACDALDKTIATIQQTPAEGLFGIGVKLAALPNAIQIEDHQETTEAALADIDRILGTGFAPMFASAVAEREEV